MDPAANRRAANRRVVVTGMGIVSCLGNDKASVTASLRELKPCSNSTAGND